MINYRLKEEDLFPSLFFFLLAATRDDKMRAGSSFGHQCVGFIVDGEVFNDGITSIVDALLCVNQAYPWSDDVMALGAVGEGLDDVVALGFMVL